MQHFMGKESALYRIFVEISSINNQKEEVLLDKTIPRFCRIWITTFKFMTFKVRKSAISAHFLKEISVFS